MPLRQGKMMSVWPQDVSVWSGRVSLVWLCMHACMCIWCVFNCGFKLLSGSLIRKYVYGYTYMEVFRITFCIFHYGFRAEMKFLCIFHYRILALYQTMLETLLSNLIASALSIKLFCNNWFHTLRMKCICELYVICGMYVESYTILVVVNRLPRPVVVLDGLSGLYGLKYDNTTACGCYYTCALINWSVLVQWMNRRLCVSGVRLPLMIVMKVHQA